MFVLLQTSTMTASEQTKYSCEVSFIANHGLIKWPEGVKCVHLNYDDLDFSKSPRGHSDIAIIAKKFSYLQEFSDKSFDESLAVLNFGDTGFIDLLIKYRVYKVTKSWPLETTCDTSYYHCPTCETFKPFPKSESYSILYPDTVNSDSIYNDLIKNRLIKSAGISYLELYSQQRFGLQPLKGMQFRPITINSNESLMRIDSVITSSKRKNSTNHLP